jgi:uncharacterized repeat protein (TIGR01451 family)
MRLADSRLSIIAFKRNAVVVALLLALFITATTIFFSGRSEAKLSNPEPLSMSETQPQKSNIQASYGQTPLSFEVNQGQTDKRVRFTAHGHGYGLFLTNDEAVIALQRDSSGASPESSGQSPAKKRDIIRMKLVNAGRPSNIEGVDRLPGISNYFIGNDPKKWHTHVPTFSKVKYEEIYPGIDLVYHGNQNQLEYDFIVAPGASPGNIAFSFKGTQQTLIDADGNLILKTAQTEVRQTPPVAYQLVNGQRREVGAGYRLRGKTVTFEIDTYDKHLPLVIDPVLIYSTFLGGSGFEQGLGIAVDSAGSAYLTGSTDSIDFPLAAPFQSVVDFADDAFVVKLNPGGTGLVYSTYLGGNGSDVGNAIAVDALGSAYVVGLTGSGSFPRTIGTIQSSKDGSIDAFISKLSASGTSLVYSTFLGGNYSDTALGVAVDNVGNAFVVGSTDSTQAAVFPPLAFARHGNSASKSIDSAAHWTASADGLTANITTAFAQDPVTPSIVYAGTNRGVFKSTDSGAHWQMSNTSPAPLTGNAIAVDPSNPNIVYIGANNGVFKSINAGITYTQKNSGLFSLVIQSLAIDPVAPSTLYAGTVFGIFKSINGGDSWTEIKNGITLGTGPRVNEIVIDPTNPATVYIGTNNRGLFKTTNAGGLWTPINTGALANSLPNITALVIDPLFPGTLYAAASQGAVFNVLFKTIDGGASWTVSDTGLTVNTVDGSFKVVANVLAIDPTTPSTVYAATNIGGIYKTTNGGATWSQSNTGLTNINATAVAVDRTTPATLYAGLNVGSDAFLTELNPTASNVLYSATIGGDENDGARGVALDSNGVPYIVGTTSSPNFPLVNALDSTLGGFTDAFVAKLNIPSGFFYSTFLGGNGSETGAGIAVRNENAFVVGTTNSSDFPLANAFKPTLQQFDTDAFVSKISTSGASLDFSTYLGGTAFDQAFSVAADSSGVYVTGSTNSIDYPAVAAPQPSPGGSTDAFVTKLNASGVSLLYSTYLGGSFSDVGNAIAIDGDGNAFVIGTTSSSNFPTANALQPTLKSTDAFVTKIGIDADLSVAKTDARDPVLVNTPIHYTLQINNAGPSPATNVVVTDALPAQLTFVSATPTQGTCSFTSPNVTCQLGSLASSAGAVVALTATASTPVTVTNTVTVTATEPDSNPENNSSSQTTKISASPSISGRVKDIANVGISGVLMTLSGGQSATTTTDSTGFYQFAELPAGATYVITPSKTNLSFSPQTMTFNNLTMDQTADFVASTCTYFLTVPSQSFTSAGGSGSVGVNSLPGCPWTATSNSNFINITSGATGVGNGTVNFDVSATTAARAGRLTIAGLNFPIYQEFNSCSTPDFSVATYNAQDAVRAEIADLNGDGKLDFVVGDTGGTSGGGGLPISLFLNNGSGGFALNVVDSGLGILSGGFVLADFNSDSRPDIALMNVFSIPASTRILFNNGSGGFGASVVDIPFTSQGEFSLTSRLLTSDVNLDGKSDLLLQPRKNNIEVLLGNGSGGFTQIAPVNFNVADGPMGLADVNSDGKPDLLFGRGNADRPLSVRLGDGTGSFGAVITSQTPVVNFTFAPADFNGDGNLDIATAVLVPNSSNSGVAILLGDGTGHFTLNSIADSGSTANAGITTADFNRDGKPDVAITRGDTKVFVFLSDGVGGLGSPIQISTQGNDNFPGNFGIAAGDFDGDSRPDLAVANATIGAFALRNACGAAPSIFGRVTDINTRGLTNVAIAITGTLNTTTQTDSFGNFFVGNLTPGGNYLVTPSKDNYRFVPVSTSVNNLGGTQPANFVGTAITIQFEKIHYLVNEGTSSIQINVTRTGDLSGVSTVNYSTINGSASDRSDYTAALGTLTFGPGDSQKSFQVLLTDDVLIEGFENLTLRLSNATGAILATPFDFLPSNVLMEIQDNDFNPAAINPLENSAFFVRQHYHDFLNREPDPSGLQFWIDNIEVCGGDAQCREVKRINTSAAFFLSIEFQNTGYFVYKMYKAAYGDSTSPNVVVPVPIIRLNEFLPDTQQIGLGVIVGQGNWEQLLENNKMAFASEFVQRQRFITAFPLSMSADEFVTELDQNAGAVLSTSEKANLVAMLGATPSDSVKRALVLRAVAEDTDLQQREFNRAFVMMQYFGYMRRNPDDPQDNDFRGWEFWLNKLNQFNGNFVNAEMVKAFLQSSEYRGRFGP